MSAGALSAQDEEAPPIGWFDTAELALFASEGNAEVQTISLRNTATRRWQGASLEIAAGAVRAETTTTSRVAVGTASDFVIRESSESMLTAENYFLRSRYDRELSKKLFWFAGLGWDRNEFAGINSRTAAFGGVGHVWQESKTTRLRTDYGATVTDQADVSGENDSFGGLRLSYDYWRRLNPSTSFESALIFDGNIDETSDYRADIVNSISATLSERLALKVSLQLLYDNLPALGEVLVVQGDFVTGERILAELDSLDSILTVSLVADL
ncbi:MAG: DUF481 domain-containing protein [Thermoanaerobaculia bacterium]